MTFDHDDQRQGLAYILARQVTGLLQRTRLNVKILCQAWHAKNSRHMLLGAWITDRILFLAYPWP